MIDLLPPWVQEKKKTRSLIRKMATAQVVIFFVLGTIMLVVSLWGQHTWTRSAELDLRLAAFAPGPAEAATRVQSERVAAGYLEAFLSNIVAVPFNRLWVAKILGTVPQGASLSRLEYREGELLVIGEVSDIAVVEVHRANMVEIFNYVRLGRIILIGEGLYSYELWAWVGELS